MLLTLIPFALVAAGLVTGEGSNVSAWHIIAVIGGPFNLQSAVSASGSLMLARMLVAGASGIRPFSAARLRAGQDVVTL